MRLFFSYIILVSFMLQFYVPMDFLEPVVYNKVLKLDHLTYRFPRYHGVVKMLAQSVFRVILVLLIGRYGCRSLVTFLVMHLMKDPLKLGQSP